MKKANKNPFTEQEVYDINMFIDWMYTDLVYVLQVDIHNNILVDDNKKPILMDNKYIYYPSTLMYRDSNMIPFDPVMNKRLAQFLLQKYLTIYASEHYEMEIVSFFISYSICDNTKMSAVVRTTKGDIISNYYTNESLCWLDLLFKLDNQDRDPIMLQKIDKYIDYVREENMRMKEVK